MPDGHCEFERNFRIDRAGHPLYSGIVMNAQTLWTMVESRVTAARPRFWYAVKTTGVYCRPGCPSRLPQRKNVEFFMDTQTAIARGYRPCKRCKPDQSGTNWIERICAHIQTHLDESLTLNALGEFAAMSPFHLQRKFKAATGISPREYVNQQRLQAFRAGTRRGESVTDSLYGAGFGASSRLYEQANRQLGMTPADYRRGAQGLCIRYTLAKSSLGPVVMAATNKGICGVRFASGIQELRHEFPRAKFVRDDGALRGWKDALVAHIAGQRLLTALPLDVQATVFQNRVWKHLLAIPVGQTRTYGEVAKAIGQPSASRAVATACARNPVAVLVPCHRVLSADGKEMGYRWGSLRKQKLLECEAEQVPKSAHLKPQME